MNEPRRGEMVKIRPLHSMVALGAHAPGRMLDGPREVAWSAWWSTRLRDGDIAIETESPPAPKKAPHSEGTR